VLDSRIAQIGRIGLACAAGALLLAATAAIAKDAAPLLEPSEPWVMNYADDSCHLARTFGTGADAVTVEFRQFAPSENFELLVAGRRPVSALRNSFVTEFGPGGKPEDHGNALQGKLLDGRVVMETTARMWPEHKDKGKSGKSAKAWDANEGVDPLEVDRDAEAKVTQLRIGGPTSHGLTFHLGPMDKPMDAMRACLDELLTHWGIDAVAHHSLTRRAAPTSDPGRWLTTSDYPTNMLRENRSGVVHFRLMVDAQGKPSSCIVQTGGSDFDKLTCVLLMKRAHFVPALDARGNPIPSYYSNSVVWLV
jgi:TonB-like protein